MAENVVAVLEANARRHAARPALVWNAGAVTWAELAGLAGGCARDLASRGVRPGDRVAVMLPNDRRFVAAVLAVLKLGATAAPLNPLLGPEDRDAILGHLRPVCVVDDVPAAPASWPTVDRPDAPALVLYTSGSTGRPKGAALSHAALGFGIRSWAGPVMALTGNDRVLAALPLAHSFGLNGALLAPLLAGATVVLVERFSPEAALGAVGRHHVTVLPGVATMFRRMLDSPALAATDLTSLRIALSGAAPCPWELARDWQRRTGVRILRGYGMTELFRPISYLAGDPRDLPESVGRAVPGVDLAVVDDMDRAVEPREAGELLIRTPAALDGYLDDPDATRAVLRDGWFRTGDLAVVDAGGFVTIVGRKRDLILRGGYSVVPQEVERVLASHPDVGEAAVVGVPHAELGEEVAAFVTLRDGATATGDELVAFCREHLAAYKYPRAVTVLTEFPRTATGKILKTDLASLARTPDR
ncbi:MAG: AMP-binding protein [Candidatus Rokubacteria bacterium]|nr:AMP-binding protein [Candidatus Rokubacteria bacterium]